MAFSYFLAYKPFGFPPPQRQRGIMKRPAICLFVTVAIVGWAAIGHAKKGGGGKAADAGEAKPADDSAAASDPKAEAAGAEAGGEAVEPEPGKVEEEIGAEPKAQKATTTLTWKDIVVLPRKASRKPFGPSVVMTMRSAAVSDAVLRIA